MYNRFIKKDGEVLLDLTDDSVSSSNLLQGITAHDKSGEKVTGTMPVATQATPSVTVNSSGLITATATQTAGYVSAGTKSGTKQLTTQAAKTITPSKSSQTAVASGRYTTGAVTVAAIPSNYIIPSGTKTITANGTHDVKSYANISVNVPTGGSGGSVETVTITNRFASEPDAEIHYIDGTMTLQSEALQKGSAYEIAKGTIFVTNGMSRVLSIGCLRLCGDTVFSAYLASGI